MPRVDWLIPTPYVDNGEPYNLSVIEEKWSAEHKLAFGRHASAFKASREVDTADGTAGGAASHHYTVTRNVPIFFGGRTSTRIGPGHAQQGYYTRWSLMRSWAQHDKWAAHSNLGVPGSGGGRGFERVLIVDSDRGKLGRLLAPQHAARNDAPTHATARQPHKRKVSSLLRHADPEKYIKLHQPWRDIPATPFCGTIFENGVANLTRGCLPPCNGDHRDAINLRTSTHGACHGKYDPGKILLRSRFALCLRGDIPSSPRPYDVLLLCKLNPPDPS